MTASRSLPPLLATLVVAAAFAGSARAQVPLQPLAPYDPSVSQQPQAPFGVPAPSGTETPFGAQGSQKTHHGLRTLDLNGDGMLSRAEVGSRRHLARKFDEIDSNRDGELSRDELRAWRSAHHAARGAGTAAAG